MREFFSTHDDVMHLVEPERLKIASSSAKACGVLERAMQRYRKEVREFGRYAKVKLVSCTCTVCIVIDAPARKAFVSVKLS